MSEYNFNQLVDITQIRQLLESHHTLSGMAYGLLDPDENDLVSVGWQDICVRFHRINPLSCARCRESNAYIKDHLHDNNGDPLEYRCGNGMIDVAMPIIIDGEHLATFFAGQFFYDDDMPDRDFFSSQAKALGFDTGSYLAALDRVPVFSRAFIRNSILFLGNMVGILARCGFNNLKLTREVEERKRMEHEVNSSRDYLANIINAIADPVFVKDATHRLVLVNDAECTLAGRLREELLGKTDYDFFPKEQVDVFWNIDNRVLESGEAYDNEERITDAAGRVRTVVTHKSRYVDPHGNRFVVGIVRDITERKLIEEQLCASEQRFREIFDNSQDCLYLLEATGEGRFRNLEVNPAFVRSVGMSRTELLGKYVDETVGDETAKKVIAKYRRCVEAGTVIEEEVELDLPGGRRSYRSTLVPVRNESGRIHRIVGITRDITERKRIEEQLRASEQQFRTLAENSPDMIIRYDRDCRRIYVNPAYERESEIPVQDALHFAPNADRWRVRMPLAEYRARLGHVMETGVPAEITLEWPRLDTGRVVSHAFHVVAERNTEGAIIGCLAIGHNITALKEVELRLTKLAETSPGVMCNLLLRPDGTTCMPYVSPRIEELNGLRPEDIAADMTEANARIHPGDTALVKDSITESARTLSPLHTEFRVLHPSKGEVWVEGHSTPEPQPNGAILWSGFLHDITERKRAEESLRAKREQLAAMTVALSLAEKRERRRIAAELHDHIGQTLLLSRIKLGTLAEEFQSGIDEKTYDEIQELLEQTIRNVRSLTQQLNPPMLASVGLEAALEWLAKLMEVDYALRVEFVDDRKAKPLSEELASVIYQSARELLINVAKHAGTDAAKLTVARESEMLLLTVEDQGCGFACLPEPGGYMPPNCSYGLFNIQQRINHLGGEVMIDSAPGRGTRAFVRVPLAPGPGPRDDRPLRIRFS